jgi:quinol monooxygenase YgiN
VPKAEEVRGKRQRVLDSRAGDSTGQLEVFKALVSGMVEATRANEPGALNYEWLISEDGTSCHIYERHADSAAVMTHMGNLGAFGERWAASDVHCTDHSTRGRSGREKDGRVPSPRAVVVPVRVDRLPFDGPDFSEEDMR